MKQMLAQKTGGSIVSITAALADNPIAGIPASVAMITKGGLETRHPRPGDGICKAAYSIQRRSPGVVDTPLHANDPKEELRKQQSDGHHLDR